ncbi:STN domain-containing protein [Parabacteroides pacaensis]|uniref:STN domain-containing protein n=1 Tax=Parabacteroides pacaensis TaxID=2086575 RepID=UPI001F263E2E|nr:STN domain-containing protein [Parabacteroides pacaensis]
MKITILLFVLGIVPAFSSTYSQETLLTLHIKAKKIGEVFRNIEMKSEYVFFFSDEIRPEMERKIDIRVEAETLDKILDKICTETGLSYEIIDRQVTVTKAKKEKVQVPALPQTQKKSIRQGYRS